MKKFLAIILAGLLLFALAACGSGNGGTGDKSGQNDQDGAVAAELNGKTVLLKYDANFRDLHYKHNYSEMNTNTAGSFRDITCTVNDEVAAEILLVYYVDKSVEEVMSGSDNTLFDRTVNGLDYKYFEFDRDGVPGHTYVYRFDGTTYTISFVSSYDINLFETAFMNNVRFEKEQSNG